MRTHLRWFTMQCRVVSRPPCSPCCLQSERCKLSVANPSKERNPKAAVSFDPHPERWKLLRQATAFTLVFLRFFMCPLSFYSCHIFLFLIFFYNNLTWEREERPDGLEYKYRHHWCKGLHICIIRNSFCFGPFVCFIQTRQRWSDMYERDVTFKVHWHQSFTAEEIENASNQYVQNDVHLREI